MQPKIKIEILKSYFIHVSSSQQFNVFSCHPSTPLFSYKVFHDRKYLCLYAIRVNNLSWKKISSVFVEQFEYNCMTNIYFIYTEETVLYQFYVWVKNYVLNNKFWLSCVKHFRKFVCLNSILMLTVQCV